MEIKIIKYNDEYKEKVIDFILGIQQNEFKIDVGITEQSDLKDIEKNYIQNGGLFLLAVDENNEIAGTFALVNVGSGIGAIKKVFVKKEYRGCLYDIAGRLLKMIIDFSTEHHISDLYLGSAKEFVSGHKFYKKHGFSEIEKSSLPVDFPVMDIDDKFFYYHIN